MNEYSHIRIYTRQFISGYTSGKNICDVLSECAIVLPKDCGLYGRISNCLNMLMTGEGLPEEDPLKSSLSVIDEGEPLLVILHDMIVHAESVGRMDEDLFTTYEDMISYIGEENENRNKSLRRKKDKSAELYERLKKCRRKNASKHLKKELIKDLKNELILCMTSMVIYTRMKGVNQGLKQTCLLTKGFLRVKLKNLRKRYEAGENLNTLCRDFLSELKLPEINQCFTCCFAGEAEHYTVPMGGGLFLNEGKRTKRKIPGKEICTVFVAVIIGAMGIMGISAKDDKKEGRLKNALTQSLMTAVGDMKDERGRNQIMAGFMQQMLKEVDDDIDLTVRICDLDELDQTMEVEAIGEYDSFLGDRRRISVRRRLSF